MDSITARCPTRTPLLEAEGKYRRAAMQHPAVTRLAPLLLAFTVTSCDCDGLEGVAALGSIEPPILDLGPVPLGTECRPVLALRNSGTSDLNVDGSELTNVNGQWTLVRVPGYVGFGSSADLIFSYTSSGTIGQRQNATVELTTNDPRENGILRATLTALPVEETAGIAVARCGAEDALCEEVSFGTTQIGTAAAPAPGVTREILVVNEGNGPLVVSAAVLDGGDGDFQILSVLRGTIEAQLPVTLAPAREGACEPLGEPRCDNAESCSVLTIKVQYRPTALGADASDLVIFTDATEGSELRVGLTGQGSDVGIITLPDYVSFAGISEGQSSTREIRVLNVGSRPEPVNNTCIDLEGDGECDGACTGGDADKVLEGALGCDVTKADGSNEGKGFVLGATDAATGGDDERLVLVTWAPVAGNAAIPPGAVLRLETNLSSNDGVLELPLVGSNAGVLRVDAPAQALCGEGLCISANSDTPETTTTWAGELTFDLVNEGDATLTISGIRFDESQPTVADDFALEDEAGISLLGTNVDETLAVGDRLTVTLIYENNDFSQQDITNLQVEHNGVGGELLVPITVVPPQP
ncbi:MAG: hypothetical protein ACO3JL_17450 [Myxococcota bacterium]